VAGLFGALAGLLEAWLVAVGSRHVGGFGELYGYSVSIDAAAFGVLGGLLGLLASGGARLCGRRLSLAWLVTLVSMASSLLVGFFVCLRSQLTPGPELLPATGRGPIDPAVAMGAAAFVAVMVGMLLAPWRGSQVRASVFASRLAPLALGALLFGAFVGVVRDLGGQGLLTTAAGASARPAAQAPLSTTVTSPTSRSTTMAPSTAATPVASGLAAPAVDGEQSATPTAVSAASTTDTGPPNVVLITVDSLRADHVGAYGYGPARTPNLDRLASEGVLVRRSYTSRNSTTPAHAGLFTGAYPSTHQVHSHMLDLLAPGVPTLAQTLADQGYATAGLFSWLALEPAYSGLDRGFEVYRDLTINLPDYLANPRSAMLAATYKRVKTLLALPATLDRELAFSADIEEILDGKADVTTDAASLWLEEFVAAGRDHQRPLFLWVHYWDPHYPYTPPSPFDQIDSRECPGCPDGSLPTIRRIQSGALLDDAQTRQLVRYYDGEVAFTDQEIGRLLETLDRLGLGRNAVIVVSGDHGESFGELGRWLHSGDLLEAEIHVPLILRFPQAAGLVGRRIEAVAGSIDVMPTVLDYLGLPIPPTVDGQSLMPLARGEQSGDERFIVAELADRSLMTLVTRDWQLLRDSSGGQRLYQVTSAGHQQEDRATSLPDVAAELARWLDQWLAAHP
jgi:arylsulfatase A-like enzyme